MTRNEAICEATIRCMELGEAGIPWFARPVAWAGTGRAVAPNVREISPDHQQICCFVISRPGDPYPEAPEDGEWEVVKREVWQKERGPDPGEPESDWGNV